MPSYRYSSWPNDFLWLDEAFGWIGTLTFYRALHCGVVEVDPMGASLI